MLAPSRAKSCLLMRATILWGHKFSIRINRNLLLNREGGFGIWPIQPDPKSSFALMQVGLLLLAFDNNCGRLRRGFATDSTETCIGSVHMSARPDAQREGALRRRRQAGRR